MTWRERLDTVKARLGIGNGSSGQLVPVRHGEPEAMSDQPTIAAPVDVYENDRELVVIADMPGSGVDAVRACCDGNGHLVLAGRGWTRAASARALYCEWQPCTWQRRLALPGGVDGDAATARYRDGVLSVHIPKRRVSASRSISVRGG